MRRGFTLIELMAVILLLGILITITVPVLTDHLQQSEKTAYQEQVRVLETAASRWALSNDNLLPTTDGESIRITPTTLMENGLITQGDIINPKDSSNMEGCITITYRESYKQYDYVYSDPKCVNADY